MKHFWYGFSKHSAPVQFKRHVIVLYWSPEDPSASDVHASVRKLSFRYPSVKVKVINIEKDALKPTRHEVFKTPTVLLLKNGREVDRISDGNKTLIEQLFRKAHV